MCLNLSDIPTFPLDNIPTICYILNGGERYENEERKNY